MRCKRLIESCFLIFLCTAFLNARSQSSALCPPNLDFEAGDFSNWVCKTGKVYAGPNNNYVTWTGVGQVPMRHEIIPAGSGTDPYGLFPMSCPNGSGFSVRLGNQAGGAEADGIFYTYDVPADVPRFAIIYNYAIVLQDPGHLPYEQPRFRARITDVATGTEINCVSFDFTASALLPGFLPSPTFAGVLYKDWTPISVDLTEYRGKKVQIEFITSDCTFSQHFGYAYIDINSTCNGIISGSTICNGETSLTLTAPFGFESYQWYADNTFLVPLSNTQTLYLPALPLVGTIFPVIVKPYPSFGCMDTLYAEITFADKPVSVAGPDKNSCLKQDVQIGGPNTVGYSYTWTPVGKLRNPAVSNPYVLAGLAAPTEMIVKTTDLNSGCFSYDTVKVTPFVVDTLSDIAGQTVYCPSEPTNALIAVNNPSTTVQWYNGNSPISGATGHTYQPHPSSTTTFHAEITQGGCVDVSRDFVITILPKPNVSFTINRDVQCINNLVPFINTTTIEGNEAMTYLWKFSDNTFDTDRDPKKSFSTIGDASAKLIATSSNNCVDSASKVISLVNKCAIYMPSAFTPNNDGLNDIVKPYLAGMNGLKRFTVYNRYGNVIFTTTKEGEGWDGTYKGVRLDTGVYIWALEYENNFNKVVWEKGIITLIR